MNSQLKNIFNEIKKDKQNLIFTNKGIEPLYYASPQAKILLIGQAPGKKAQDTKKFWNDVSGERLRDWMGVTADEFYNTGKFAVLPMDFCYPGKGKSGDLPPRKDFAEKWHPKLLELMPNIELTILIGSYATKKYLNLKSTDKLTDVVKNFQDYAPEYFPLIHPSPRNRYWVAKNPWFADKVLPELKREVRQILS